MKNKVFWTIVATITLIISMTVNVYAAAPRLICSNVTPESDEFTVTISFEGLPSVEVLTLTGFEYDKDVFELVGGKWLHTDDVSMKEDLSEGLMIIGYNSRKNVNHNENGFGAAAELTFKKIKANASGSYKYRCKAVASYSTDDGECKYQFPENVVDDAKYTGEVVEGVITFKCSHHNTKKHDEIPATCKGTGTKAHEECLDCGKLLIDGKEVSKSDLVIPIDLNNHVGDTEVRNDKPATCSEEGYTGDTYCKSCGAKIKDGEAIAKLAHTPSTEWTTDKTQHWHVCTVCNTKLDEAAHTFDWTVIKDATEDEEGLEKGVCSVCKYEIERDIPVKGHEHKFEGEWKSNTDGHWQVCKCGTESEKAAHTFDWTVIKEATEDKEGLEKGVCSVCEYETEREIPKKNHVHTMTYVPGKPATCVATGTCDHWRCTACNNLFADKDGNTEITNTILPVDPANHQFNGNTCVACGYTRPSFNNMNNAPVYLSETLHGFFHNGQMIPYPHTPDFLGQRTDGESTWYVCGVCGHEYGKTAAVVSDESGDLVQVIDVDTPAEAGDNAEEVEGDNVNVADNAPAKSENPKTGIALSVIPAVLALLAIAVKKR